MFELGHTLDGLQGNASSRQWCCCWNDPVLPLCPGASLDGLKSFATDAALLPRQGTCDQGSLCSFAHGQAELRRKGDPVPSIDYLRSLYTGAKPPDNEW